MTNLTNDISIFEITSDKNGVVFSDYKVNIEKIVEYFWSDENIKFLTESFSSLIPKIKNKKIKKVDLKRYINKMINIKVDSAETIIKGSFGEHILNILAKDALSLSITVPKYKYKTNPNMPVFGSDGLFISDNEIFFGESKFFGDLESGITNINNDITKYDDIEQIKNSLDPIYEMKKLMGFRQLSFKRNLERYIDDIAELRKIYKFSLFAFVGFEKSIEEYKFEDFVSIMERRALKSSVNLERIKLFAMPYSSYENLLEKIKELVSNYE